MVCLARTGTCAFPHEVDLSDKTVLERYSHNWGNLSGAALQVAHAARRDTLRGAAPDQSGVAVVAEVPNRDFPIFELRLAGGSWTTSTQPTFNRSTESVLLYEHSP
jgi:hypothetical protein